MSVQEVKLNHTIMIVDDDALFRATLVGMLSNDYRCIEASSGREVIEYCRTYSQPDLILMDYNMSVVDGVTVAKRLKQMFNSTIAPIVFLTGHTDVERQTECWQAGASDFISKPVLAEVLKLRIDHQISIKERERFLEKQSCTDSLTGLYNRQYIKQYVPDLVRALNREHRSMSMLMIDVDDFKKFNDSYGHVEGDNVLKQVAKVLRRSTKRPTDCVIRFGGEEFVVLLPKTNLDGAKMLARQISVAVEKLGITNEKSTYGKVTVSIGVASSKEHASLDFIETMKKADKAMYKAKKSGKNNVVADDIPGNESFRYAMVGGKLNAV